MQEEKGPNAFPLYTEAVKLLHHPDGLVGAAVRSLTLNVYAAADPAVQRFILSPPASHFFTQLAKSLASAAEVGLELCHGHTTSSSFAAEDCHLKGNPVQAVHRELSQQQCSESALLGRLEAFEDMTSYCDDILSTGTQSIALLQAQV